MVFTSDHGEGLGEHGYLWHGVFLYEEALHVPLVLRGAGRLEGGRTVRTVTSAVDVAATVIELLGFPGGEGPRGSSLLRFAGEGEPRAGAWAIAERYRQPGSHFSERGLPLAEGDSARDWERYLDQELYAVVRDDWKAIRGTAGTVELYYLGRDPEEAVDLGGGGVEAERELLGILDAWLEQAHPRVDALRGGGRADEVEEMLDDLGY